MTIARKLWVAFGALILIIAVMGLAIEVGVRSAGEAIDGIITVEEPASAAAYEMEINAISTDLTVRRYLDTRDSEAMRDSEARSEAREHFREDTEAFARSKSEYDEAVKDTEEREASDRVGELYEEHRSLGEGLMDRQDEQDKLLAEISREFDRMDTTFDDDLQSNIGGESPGATEKARQAAELELDVVEVNAWFGTFLRVPSEDNRKFLFEDIDDSRSGFAEFAALDLTPVEREAADELASLFEANVARIERAVAHSDALQRDLTEFTDLRGQIDAVLDEEVQVVARSELQEAGKVADSAAERTQVVLLVMLIVGLVVGAGAAYFISRGIISSLNKLVEGANRIGGGSLEHRISVRSQDEIGALAVAFNEMAEKRQNAEGELARLAHQNTLLLDSAGEGIFGLNAEGCITFTNPTAASMFGYEAEELVGKNMHDLLHHTKPDGSPYPVEECPIYATLKNEDVHRIADEVFWRKDGTSLCVEYTSTPVEESGETVGAVVVFKDITERRRVEEELVKASEAAEASNMAKSEFLANMSHEIRTPMNGVIGMTGLLMDTDLSEEQREYAETVRTSGENLLTIINDILDFSKIEAGKLDLEKMDFDLVRMVEETADMLAERAHAKDLELASIVEADVPTALRGDAGRVRQILLNLLGNAVKFTERGEVVLSVGVGEGKEAAGQALVRFEIKDTGIGMTDEQRARLFQSFTQADSSTTRKYGGTGLGLAISKQLVELMGGEIGVESEPGEGSTFWFAVPFEKQRREGEPPRRYLTGHGGNTDLRDLRVLVVDDNETNRRILCKQTSAWVMENESAADGHGALALLERAARAGTPYDLAILDMQMPGMDGMELSSRIKADPRLAQTRLVLLTSMGLAGESERALRAGFAAALTKPVRQSKLFDVLVGVMDAVPVEGEVRVENARAEGVRAEVARAAEEAGAGAGGNAGAKAGGKAGRRPWRAHVLVAEDNQINQKVAVKMLERLGYRADVAANGFEALEALSSIPYAAVLMDVQMPEMGGYEATAEIRRREEGQCRRISIIAMTANAMQGDREKALSMGMDDYIPKPVKLEDLEAVLKRWVSEEREPEGREATVPEADDGLAEGDVEASLDRSVLAGLRGLQEEGEPDILGELIGLFLTDAPPQLVALREATEAGDVQSVERIAHTLKGSCGNMGAVGMAALCTELERMGRSEKLAAAPVGISRLEEELGRVRAVFERELAKN